MQVDIERLDPCGRTALHVAVSLGRTECVKILLDHHANANTVNKKGWNGKMISENLPGNLPESGF